MPKPTLNKVPLVPTIVTLSIILLIIALTAWFRSVYSRPSVVFDRMLNAMLSTPGVSKQILQSEGNQSVAQRLQLTTMPQERVHSTSAARQGTDGNTLISTESVGTLRADYVRYTDIQTTQKTLDGKAFDFSPVIGVWGTASANDPDSGGAQLFNQTVLGVVPIGNLGAGERKKLLEQIKKDGVYEINQATIKRQIVNGRPVYSYDVTIHPMAYVAMLKSFAHSIGVVELDQVDPSQYRDSSPLSFTFDIDVWSGQLTKVTYKDSSREETYNAYGARLQIEPPDSTVTVQELQTRLQQLQ